ncbi:MAG: ribosome maturation factor RimP [Lachnospiraceae bacterium]|nr:ribosome maturation factor RimP [Lachnospiraceae bacterium]
MAGKKDIETRAEQLLQPITDAQGVRIYDVEYVKEGSDWYLRAYIDKDGGVTIEDCEAVSRAYSEKLDEADLIKDAYILEVSSPGLGRQLKKDRHFENSLGEEVELKLFEAVDGEKEFTGILKAYDKDTVTIEAEGGDTKTFERSKLAVIRLTVDF